MIGVTAFFPELDEPRVDTAWRIGKHHVGQPDSKQGIDADNACNASVELDEPEEQCRRERHRSDKRRRGDFQEERVKRVKRHGSV